MCVGVVVCTFPCDQWERFHESSVSFGVSFPPRSRGSLFTCPIHRSRHALSGNMQRLKRRTTQLDTKYITFPYMRLQNCPPLNWHLLSISRVVSALCKAVNTTTRKIEKNCDSLWHEPKRLVGIPPGSLLCIISVCPCLWATLQLCKLYELWKTDSNANGSYS